MCHYHLTALIEIRLENPRLTNLQIAVEAVRTPGGGREICSALRQSLELSKEGVG